MNAEYSAFSSALWSELVGSAVDVANAIITEGWSAKYSYHNPAHTEQVIGAVDLLATDLGLGEEQRATLLIAAAFHDSGFFLDAYNHENLGATFAADFLISRKVRVDIVGRVAHLIQSTALHVRPVTPLQQLLRDADLHYLGCDGLPESAENLRKEWEVTKNLRFSEPSWIKQNIRFMEVHRFHTEAAEERFGVQKRSNIIELKDMLERMPCTP